MMRGLWAQGVAAVAKWNLRERVLVLVAVLAALAGLAYVGVVEPYRLARAREAAETMTWQTELTALRVQLDAAAATQQTPLAQAEAGRVTALRTQLAALAREIGASAGDASQVGQLRPAVHRLLSRHERVQLVALEAGAEPVATAAPVAATSATSADAQAPVAESAPQLQRYNVSVTLEGAYLDLLAYLEALERELPEVRWGDMKLTVLDTGGVRLSLNLYMWWRPA